MDGRSVELCDSPVSNSDKAPWVMPTFCASTFCVIFAARRASLILEPIDIPIFSSDNELEYRLTEEIGVPILGVMNIPFILSELQRVGLTQSQIANSIGLKQPTISDMATGKAGTKRPSFQVVDGLTRLAAEYQVAVDPPSDARPQ